MLPKISIVPAFVTDRNGSLTSDEHAKPGIATEGGVLREEGA